MRNYAAAFEVAMAETIRAVGSIGAGVAVLPFQTPTNEPLIDKEGHKELPAVTIAAVPPATDDNQETLFCDLALLCLTDSDEDMRREKFRALYAGVQGVLDQLFKEFKQCGSGDTPALDLFKLKVTECLVAVEAGATFDFGGFSFQGGPPPATEQTAWAMGVAFRVHYSRDDW